MSRRRLLGWLAMAAVLVAALAIGVADDGGPRTPEERARNLAETVACPACDGQSVAESDAAASRGIRTLIAERIDQGASDDAIRDELVATWGESILLTPDSSGVGGLVWVLPVVALVLALAGVGYVFWRWRGMAAVHASDADRELVDRALGSVQSRRRGRAVTAVDGTRPLDPDALAALEEQRDFLLRSLEDLEREHDAGDVDDHDYASLKDDYTARAARSIRAIEAHHARVAAARPPRPWPRTLAVLAGVVAFAVVAGVLVARFSGRREAGDALTGDIRESTRTQLDNARLALQQEHYDDAIEIYDAVLADQPGNIEAMAYKGRAQIGNGDMEGVLTLIDAAEADPDYPDTHYFLAGAFAIAGRYDSALQELDRFDGLDPPPELAAEADDLRSQIEALQAAASSSTTTPAPAP